MATVARVGDTTGAGESSDEGHRGRGEESELTRRLGCK
jgi:hypothetical protein